MTDIFSSYERGLEELLNRLGRGHPRYAETLTLQARLRENIDQTRLYGDTETRRAERAQIVEALNDLALNIAGESFTQISEDKEVDNHKSIFSAGQAQETVDHLHGVGEYLRRVRSFPPKQVVDELFSVMDQTAQFIEEGKRRLNYGDLSLRLRIGELLAQADRELKRCRTLGRILRQLNGDGKWNTITNVLDEDPIEKLLTSLDELIGLLDEMALLL